MFRYIRLRKRIEQVALTPEGFVYLIVLCFITIGSVLRNVNLLILMAGMMYAPLFINWRLAVSRLGSFQCQRRLPHRVHANQVVSVQWECENRQKGLAGYNVIVEDRIERMVDEQQTINREAPAAGRKYETFGQRWFGELIQRLRKPKDEDRVSMARVRFQRLLPLAQKSQSYRAFFGCRGKYLAGPASVSTTFPFGLIVSRNRVDQMETFFVAPELGNLVPTWEQRVRSTTVGSDSIQRNRALEEDEFYALRPWRSGDSKKNIHWRTTARRGFPIVKQHDQQNNRDFALVVDLFDDPLREQSRQDCETALSFAATTLLRIGADIQGQVAVSVCGQEMTACRSRTPQGMVAEAMPALAVASMSLAPQVVRGIVEAFDTVSSGTPIYVVSSRSQPESLEPMQAEDESTAGSDSSEETSAIQARILSRRMRLAMPMVRWLQVDSNEFRNIFQLNQSDPNAPTEMPVALNKLTTRWGTHAER